MPSATEESGLHPLAGADPLVSEQLFHLEVQIKLNRFNVSGRDVVSLVLLLWLYFQN